jgi:hypothetical protein
MSLMSLMSLLFFFLVIFAWAGLRLVLRYLTGVFFCFFPLFSAWEVYCLLFQSLYQALSISNGAPVFSSSCLPNHLLFHTHPYYTFTIFNTEQSISYDMWGLEKFRSRIGYLELKLEMSVVNLTHRISYGRDSLKAKIALQYTPFSGSKVSLDPKPCHRLAVTVRASHAKITRQGKAE